MKIAILSTFYPFRGGIAQFNASLLDGLSRECTVKAFNFTLQYPDFLFPGKTQYVTPEDSALQVDAQAVLSTVNPFSWGKAAKAIREWGADLLIVRYWMSWFAPSLGSVARKAGCKVLAITDNIIPHEKHFFDKPLTKWFLGGVKACVCMSDEVAADLHSLKPSMPCKVLPHPLYTHFGSRVDRTEAETRLGLPGKGHNFLFFGLIRHYKGLDILIDAFGSLPSDYNLIIAGEPYGDFSEYRSAIDSSPARDRIFLFNNYIPDSEVKWFFSAADAAVLPYRSATQSGVNALALNFEVPMIVTDTGSLRATVEGRGTGIVVDSPAPEAVRDGILRFFSQPALREDCIEHIRQEQRRLSWSGFCKELLQFSESL